MNLKLTNVLSDITGVTGLAIIRDIIAGERNPHKLAAYRDPPCHKSEAEIIAALSPAQAAQTVVEERSPGRAGDIAEALSRVHHAAQEEDRAGLPVVNYHQERAIHGEGDRLLLYLN